MDKTNYLDFISGLKDLAKFQEFIDAHDYIYTNAMNVARLLSDIKYEPIAGLRWNHPDKVKFTHDKVIVLEWGDERESEDDILFISGHFPIDFLFMGLDQVKEKVKAEQKRIKKEQAAAKRAMQRELDEQEYNRLKNKLKL